MEYTIKEIRANTGMTQKAFSELLQIPDKTIKNWEQGQRKCPDYVLKLIVYYLNNEGLL